MQWCPTQNCYYRAACPFIIILNMSPALHIKILVDLFNWACTMLILKLTILVMKVCSKRWKYTAFTFPFKKGYVFFICYTFGLQLSCALWNFFFNMLCRIYTLQVTKWEPCKHINTFTVPLLSSESGPEAFWNGDLKLVVVSRGVPNVVFLQEWEFCFAAKEMCNNYLNISLLFLQKCFDSLFVV